MPSLLALDFEVDGFTGPTNELVVVGYLLLCALWPVAAVGLGLRLDRLWTGLVAFGVGILTAVVMLGIFA